MTKIMKSSTFRESRNEDNACMTGFNINIREHKKNGRCGWCGTAAVFIRKEKRKHWPIIGLKRGIFFMLQVVV